MPTRETSYEYNAHGHQVGAMVYDPSAGPIFTDGSALEAQSEVATAAFAAVQLVPDLSVRASAAGRVPAELSQRAASAERMAIAAALLHSPAVRDRPVPIYTDCTGLLTLVEFGVACAASKRWAGLLAPVREQAIGGKLKGLKAHRDLASHPRN